MAILKSIAEEFYMSHCHPHHGEIESPYICCHLSAPTTSKSL